MFDIDKIRANVPRELRCRHIVLDKLLNLCVGEKLSVAHDVEFSVEDGMTIGRARLQTLFIIWLAEAARMGELETNDQVLCRSVAFAMRADQDFSQLRQILPVLLNDNKLVGIRPAIWPHCHGLAAVDQLRPAFSKSLPASADLIRDAAR